MSQDVRLNHDELQHNQGSVAHSDERDMQSSITRAKSKLDEFLRHLNHIVLDKPEQTKLALSCILAGGHLLLQDLPGMGKTTLAESLAKLSGLSYRRVQFTSDMLPSDILGLSIFNPEKQEFEFREGPIFTQVLLADEINRTSPKTQSALLEAMEENQVSQDGVTRALPQPFFVIATQNPINQSGTYPLPESQLDRFLMCVSLGFPSAQAEREILLGQDRRAMLRNVQPLLNTQYLNEFRQLVNKIHLSEPVLDYLQQLVEQTRNGQHTGLSTRGLLALKRAAQAYALVDGRGFVIPEDIQAVFVAVADHRLGVKGLGGADSPAHQILRQVPVMR